MPDGKVPEPEVTEEVPAAKADEDIVDYDGLRKLAAEKAAKRAESQGNDKSAALEARLAQLEAAAQANAADAGEVPQATVAFEGLPLAGLLRALA
ncbi:MAG: hypothetical protein IPK74_40265 [Deltaproteobacteria bacterium]|nr:hypothetical protein [Deltaproteobacteria bacterium]